MIVRIVILSLCIFLGAKSLEHAGSAVLRSLLECYNNTENLDRERRPPSSINVLIELIRKIENGPSIQNDREISVELIHRFKQDGIEKDFLATSTPFSVPYTAKGKQSGRHIMLVKKLIPGSSANFPNETLTEIERCSLHFMLSNSIDAHQRGDESFVCNKLGRFQRRIRRDSNPNNDVEIIDPSKSIQSKGNLQEGDDDNIPQHEPEQFDTVNEQDDTDVFQSPGSGRQVFTINLSDCPLENGAVYTRWGTIQAGLVISGVAAARQTQTIPVDDGHVVDSKYAATLVGDLAEVSLHQGTRSGQPFEIGAKGGWNETQIPRWYFINQIKNTEMTDAEIRGGLDGLIIAKNLNDWKQRASFLKLSQILDMYYSPRGVFSNKKFRACNRNDIFTEVAPQEDLIEQTIATSFLLNQVATLPGSITPEGIKTYGEKAVNALNSYIANLHDLSCINDVVERANTDIIIALDFQWDYNVISRALAYLLENLDVNQYGSNFTIIDAKEGGYVVNSSNSVLDFYHKLRTVDFQKQPGFDVSRVFTSIEAITKLKMDQDRISKRTGGQSSIVLFIPFNPLTDKGQANSRKESLKTGYPDLRLMALGRNSKNEFSELVTDSNLDAFTLPDSTDGAAITDAVNTVISRIKQIHRRIINPNCDSSWSGTTGSGTLEQYIEPGTVNYYRILPNYLYGEGERSVKIKGQGYGTLLVCMSRFQERPQKNGTDKCETVNSNEVAFSLTDACSDGELQSCSPAYFSVEATETGESRNVKCQDNGCRFPDNIKFVIHVDNLSCVGSGSYKMIANIFVLLLSYVSIKLVF